MLTVEEAANRLRVSPRTIRKWIVEGKVPAVRYGRGYRISESFVGEQPANGLATGQSLANAQARQSILQRRREQEVAKFKEAFRGGTIRRATMLAEWDEELRLDDRPKGKSQ